MEATQSAMTLEQLPDDVVRAIFVQIDDPANLSRACQRLHHVTSDPVDRYAWICARVPASHHLFVAVKRKLYCVKLFRLLLSNGAPMSRHLIQSIVFATAPAPPRLRHRNSGFSEGWASNMPVPVMAELLAEGGKRYPRMSLDLQLADYKVYDTWLQNVSADWDSVRAVLEEGKFIPFPFGWHRGQRVEIMDPIIRGMNRDPRTLLTFMQNGLTLTSDLADAMLLKLLHSGSPSSCATVTRLFQLQHTWVNEGTWTRDLFRISPTFAVQTLNSWLTTSDSSSESVNLLGELDRSGNLSFDLDIVVSRALERFINSRGLRLSEASRCVTLIKLFPAALTASSSWAAIPVLLTEGDATGASLTTASGDTDANAVYTMRQARDSASKLLKKVTSISAQEVLRVLFTKSANRRITWFAVYFAKRCVKDVKQMGIDSFLKKIVVPLCVVTPRAEQLFDRLTRFYEDKELDVAFIAALVQHQVTDYKSLQGNSTSRPRSALAWSTEPEATVAWPPQEELPSSGDLLDVFFDAAKLRQDLLAQFPQSFPSSAPITLPADKLINADITKRDPDLLTAENAADILLGTSQCDTSQYQARIQRFHTSRTMVQNKRSNEKRATHLAHYALEVLSPLPPLAVSTILTHAVINENVPLFEASVEAGGQYSAWHLNLHLGSHMMPAGVSSYILQSAPFVEAVPIVDSTVASPPPHSHHNGAVDASRASIDELADDSTLTLRRSSRAGARKQYEDMDDGADEDEDVVGEPQKLPKDQASREFLVSLVGQTKGSSHRYTYQKYIFSVPLLAEEIQRLDSWIEAVAKVIERETETDVRTDALKMLLEALNKRATLARQAIRKVRGIMSGPKANLEAWYAKNDVEIEMFGLDRSNILNNYGRQTRSRYCSRCRIRCRLIYSKVGAHCSRCHMHVGPQPNDPPFFASDPEDRPFVVDAEDYVSDSSHTSSDDESDDATAMSGKKRGNNGADDATGSKRARTDAAASAQEGGPAPWVWETRTFSADNDSDGSDGSVIDA